MISFINIKANWILQRLNTKDLLKKKPDPPGAKILDDTVNVVKVEIREKVKTFVPDAGLVLDTKMKTDPMVFDPGGK